MSTPPNGPDPSDPDRAEPPRLPEQQSGGHPEGSPYGFPPPVGQPPPWHPEASDHLPRYPGGGPTSRPTEDPLVPADFAGWVDRVIGVFKRSFVPLAIIQVGVAVVSVVYQLTAGHEAAALAERAAADPTTFDPAAAGGVGSGLLLGAAVLGVVGVLSQAASVHVVIRDAARRPSSVGGALAFAGTRALPLIGWGILAVLLVVLGTFLLLLPGLYLVVVFAAAFVGVVVVERAGIGRTFTLVNPRLLPTVGRVLTIILVTFLASAVIGLSTAGLGPDSLVGTILAAGLGIPVGILGVGFTVVTYAELRNRENPAVGTTQLADQLEGRVADL